MSRVDPSGDGLGPEAPVSLREWLRRRTTAGALGNVAVFAVLAATATSRASHGVLSPTGLFAVVVGASAAATVVGWVAGCFEGASAALRGEVDGVEPAAADRLTGRHLWRSAVGASLWAALWSAAGAVVLVALLGDRSAPFAVLLVALAAVAAPAAIAVDVMARAVGASTGAALRHAVPEDVPLLRRAWRQLALPAAAVQLFVNAGVAWVLFAGAAADGTLTEATALGDTVVVAALLAGIFGALGARWGELDAAARRVAAPDGTAGHPVGAQAIVYVGLLVVAGTSLVGWWVPSEPSLLQVAFVRGVIAALLSLLAVGLGVVRGATNAAPAVSVGPASRPVLVPPPRRPSTTRARRPRTVVAAGAAAVAVVALATVPLVPGAPDAAADDLDSLGVVAEMEAFGVRVEYDIPAPVSTGTAPQVVGSARRSAGSESASGLAAAPTRLDPVVGGIVTDPDGTPGSGDELALPQAECAHPGDLADIAFTFPADLRGDLTDVPPLGWSRAICGAGPTVSLRATTVSPDEALGLGPLVRVGGVLAEADAGPSQGVLRASASAQASGIEILDGLITIDSVVARGASFTDGQPGGASTDASVDLIGVSIAGVGFDLRGGDIVVSGQHLPLGGSAAQSLLRTVAGLLAPTGCALSVLDSPASYPQGFLFARPEPELGVADDGTLAASMTGGLLLQCEIPDAIAELTGFSPQRLQVALGFVYTGVAARADIGGFGVTDLAPGTDEGGIGGGLVDSPPLATASLEAPGLGTVELPPPPAVESVASPPTRPSDGGLLAPVTERIELLAANFAADRPWVWLPAVLAWLVLSHRGLERVRRTVRAAEA